MLKEHEFDRAARVLKAMAHPSRLKILQILADGEEYTPTELQQFLGCSQPLMSQQLKILQNEALIRVRKEGVQNFVKLQNPDFIKLFHCLEHHLHNVLNA